eukprot:jgi/Antlo1/1821/954
MLIFFVSKVFCCSFSFSAPTPLHIIHAAYSKTRVRVRSFPMLYRDSPRRTDGMAGLYFKNKHSRA